jgi:hypothetical protein
MMFQPTVPLAYKPPLGKRPLPPYTGLSQFTMGFEKDPPPPLKAFEAPKERKLKLREKMELLHKEKMDILANDWDPHSNPKATEYLSSFMNSYHPSFLCF